MDGPVRRGWSSDTYPTYMWSYVRQQTTGNGYIEENTTTLDMITDYTFWMQQAATLIVTPNGYSFLFLFSSFFFFSFSFRFFLRPAMVTLKRTPPLWI
jgi:hypothetical protein